MSAKRNYLTVLLVAESVFAAVVVASQLPKLVRLAWVQDDAYVSFRYARNFVLGRGLVYNVGDYVEGYTNFLWTLLAAIPLAFGAEDPLSFMHIVGGVLWAGSYLLLLAMSFAFFAEGIWIAPLALVPLAFHWSYNMWFLSGMETPLVCFLTTAAVFFFARDPERHPRTLFWASLAGVALTMTRPDGAITMAGLTVAGVLCYGRRVFVERKWRTYVLLPLLPLLFLYLPFNLWRIWYYGSFYPNTYYAKVAYLTYYTRGWVYLAGFLQIYGLVPWLPFLPLGALFCRNGMARRFLVVTTVVSAAVVLYVVRLGGDFMEWRFLTPIAGIVYPAIVVGADALVKAIAAWRRRASEEPPERRGARAGWVGGLIATGLLVVVTRGAPGDRMEWYPGGLETIGLLRRYCDPGRYDWRSAGKLFNEVLPPKVKIATTSAGMIPYFCDRPCLDLHGLTDPQIAREPVTQESRGRVGHEHWLQDLDVMRKRGVDIVLDWADPHPYPSSIFQPPTEKFEKVSVKLPDNRYVDFLILNPKDVDRAALASDPRVVLYGSVPVADKKSIYLRPDGAGDWRVVDRIDIEEGESEKTHDFKDELDNGHRGSWHTKFMRYSTPQGDVQLEDNGRRFPIGASWKVHDVRAGFPLLFAVRYDHTLGGVYDVDVNGKRLPQTLNTPGGSEIWDEAWVEVPADLLVDGTNEFRITKRQDKPGDAEIYHLWFLQPGAAAANAEAPPPS